MILRARQFRYSFPGRALIMGVVNVTPDSFSDGGRFKDSDEAVDYALKLVAEGADIIDIGGESTRPGAAPVSEKEELARVLAVIQRLASQTDKAISVDTVKPAVAEQAIEAGASIINDVGANRDEPEMWRLVAKSGAGYIVMHMQGTPQTMQRNPQYDDVISTVHNFFENRLSRLHENGVMSEQIMLDVGIGFGKALEHNLQLLRALPSFTRWDRPMVLGVSRKGFIGQLTGAKDAGARLPGSLACACWGIASGVQIIRTHDVAETRQVIRVTEAILMSKT